jgi:hypothetical protein
MAKVAAKRRKSEERSKAAAPRARRERERASFLRAEGLR